MSDWVTPQRLAGLYDFFRACPPFSRWKLPESDAVEFQTSTRRDLQGECARWIPEMDFVITISIALNGHLDGVAIVLAHEMIHLGQKVRRTETPNTGHNADFLRQARITCRRFGWDFKAFPGTR